MQGIKWPNISSDPQVTIFITKNKQEEDGDNQHDKVFFFFF